MIIRKDSSFMYSTHHDCIWGGGKSELLNYVQLVHSNHNKEYNISFSLWHWCALHILNVYRTYVWMHWNMTSCILCITYEHIFKFILKIRFIIDCMYMHIRDRYEVMQWTLHLLSLPNVQLFYEAWNFRH